MKSQILKLISIFSLKFRRGNNGESFTVQISLLNISS